MDYLGNKIQVSENQKPTLQDTKFYHYDPEKEN